MTIPVYEASMPDGDWSGILNISLVDEPAMEVGFAKYSNENPTPKVHFNKEQKTVVGAVIVPDKLIYREDAWTGEPYYVTFGKDVIRKMCRQMLSNGANSSFSVHHADRLSGWKVQCEEVWIKESQNDKSIDYGFDLPDGTLFMKAKVNDDDLWERIKDGEFNGFSMEAINDFQYKYMTEKLIFSKVEVGQPIMVRTIENAIELFSGEFDHEGNHVVAKDGKIEEVKPIEEPVKEDVENEDNPADNSDVDGGTDNEVHKELEEVKTELSAIKESLNNVLKGLEQFGSVKKEVEAINERMALQNLAYKQQQAQNLEETKVAVEPQKVDRLTILSKTKNIFKEQV
jgi:hypothetical protein